MQVKLIALGVGLLIIIGTVVSLSLNVRHYKKLYLQDEKTIVVLNEKITSMTTKQNSQTKLSGDNVTKVVQGPKEVESITKVIHDAPLPPDCKTPVLPSEVLNAF